MSCKEGKVGLERVSIEGSLFGTHLFRSKPRVRQSRAVRYEDLENLHGLFL